MFFHGKIADFIPKLSHLPQFHPSTVKTSKSILELSKPAQFHPSQSARASIQYNRPFCPYFLFLLKQHQLFSPSPQGGCTGVVARRPNHAAPLAWLHPVLHATMHLLADSTNLVTCEWPRRARQAWQASLITRVASELPGWGAELLLLCSRPWRGGEKRWCYFNKKKKTGAKLSIQINWSSSWLGRMKLSHYG
jgi:hypothetical protein